MVIGEIAKKKEYRFNNFTYLLVFNTLNRHKFVCLVVQNDYLRPIDLNGQEDSLIIPMFEQLLTDHKLVDVK